MDVLGDYDIVLFYFYNNIPYKPYRYKYDDMYSSDPQTYPSDQNMHLARL